MRLNITRLMHTALPLAVLLLTACGGTTRYISIGGTVTGLSRTGLTGSVVLQDNGVNNLTVPVDGAFTIATDVASFENGYNVTVLTQPAGQTCSVTGGSGTTTTNVTSVAVKCKKAAPRYAYVVNEGSNDISQYTIAVNGTLTALATETVAAGTTPYSIAVDPLGQYAYVANYGDGTVSQYTIGTPSSLTPGALAPMSPPTVLAGSNPISVTVVPSGSHVYVANYSSGASAGTVSEYSIGTGGALATIGTVGTGKNPSFVTVDPSGQYAYVANLGDGTVSQYTISSGVLSATAATVTVGGQPISVITAR